MSGNIWIIVGIFVLMALFAIFFLRRKRNIPENYKTWFIIGVTWIPLGIATDNHVFTVMGAIFMAIGLKNKSKWKENDVKWSDLSSDGKKVRVILIATALILILAGLVLLSVFM